MQTHGHISGKCPRERNGFVDVVGIVEIRPCGILNGSVKLTAMLITSSRFGIVLEMANGTQVCQQ